MLVFDGFHGAVKLLHKFVGPQFVPVDPAGLLGAAIEQERGADRFAGIGIGDLEQSLHTASPAHLFRAAHQFNTVLARPCDILISQFLDLVPNQILRIIEETFEFKDLKVEQKSVAHSQSLPYGVARLITICEDRKGGPQIFDQFIRPDFFQILSEMLRELLIRSHFRKCDLEQSRHIVKINVFVIDL